MIDGIIKADGTSRLMRAELPATYEEFRAQCRAGTQPLDVLFNALGWSQLPTFLNKANLLKDPTAALFELSSNAVLDDVFAWIGKYNTHWWSILHGQAGYGYNEAKTLATPLPSDGSNTVAVAGSVVGVQQSIYYSKTVTIDQITGVVSLDNQQTLIVTPSASPSDVTSQLNSLAALAPAYIKNLYGDPDTIYYIPAGVTVKPGTSGSGFSGFDEETFGVSKFPDFFSARMNLSTYCLNRVYVVTSQAYNIPAGATTYVHSIDRNAYPDSGTVDGLTYQYLGIPFQNAVTAPNIATGSYVGTGTYGANNPVSITFDFEPKIVLFYSSTTSAIGADNMYPYIFLWGVTTRFGYSQMTDGQNNISYSGNTISWYNTSNAANQHNTSGSTFRYVAIG